MKGIGAASGIAIGLAMIKESRPQLDNHRIQDPAQELYRLSAAIELSRQQLLELVESANISMGNKEAQIFEAHIMILEDPELMDRVRSKITLEKVNAAWAVQQATAELVETFAAIEDPYIKDRVLDLHDVAERLIENIMGWSSFAIDVVEEGAIVVAKELTPSDMSKLSAGKVAGIATETGGVTSHTAIISRVMGIPAVVAIAGLTEQIKNGDLLIIDGGTGELYVNPESFLIEHYRQRIQQQQEEQRDLQQFIGVKSISEDGYEISIGCNIGSPKDLEAVLKNDGEGIGLFRSEFLYMDRSQMPSEEEQFEAYKAAAESMRGKPVIIRTLDIGGDKQIPYMDFPKEDNPFLGYRAIRYCLQEPELFRIQLRAMLRAGAYGAVKIMLPMISCIEEVRAAKQQLDIAKQELEQRSESFDKTIELGIMIETPGAAMISDMLAKEVDFFSIGTNDLTQYTLAVDRMNSKIADLYTPYHPAVLRLIKLVADNANNAGIWVGMCGEAAQEALLTPLFLGMGLHELSVNPSMVLKLRKQIRSLNKTDMEKHVKQVLSLSSTEAVLKYLESIKVKISFK